jgi:hypothetical protein
MYKFGLNGKPYSISDLLREVPNSALGDPSPIGDLLPFSANDIFQPKIVWRQCSQEPIKKRVFMSETGTYIGD